MAENPRSNRHRTVAGALREQIAVRRVVAEQVISLANLLGRPVVNDVGTRIGKVSDIVVSWDAKVAYPPMIGVMIRVGSGFALIDRSDVSLTQTQVRLRSDRQIVSRPVRNGEYVALARDVLDRQLVDVTGVQIVRAADVYLLNGPRGWELAGIDVGWRSLARRLLTRRKVCPPPHRAIDWADLQAFVPRFTDIALPGPAAAAGTVGGGMQLASPAAELRKLRAQEVAAILAELGSGQRAALFAELGESNRARLQALPTDGAAP